MIHARRVTEAGKTLTGLSVMNRMYLYICVYGVWKLYLTGEKAGPVRQTNSQQAYLATEVATKIRIK